MASDPKWPGVAGKRVLITGATRGIGLAAAIELARRGALLTLVARTGARAADAVRQIHAAAGGASVDVLTADLASQASIRQFAIDVQAKYSRRAVPDDDLAAGPTEGQHAGAHRYHLIGRARGCSNPIRRHECD